MCCIRGISSLVLRKRAASHVRGYSVKIGDFSTFQRQDDVVFRFRSATGASSAPLWFWNNLNGSRSETYMFKLRPIHTLATCVWHKLLVQLKPTLYFWCANEFRINCLLSTTLYKYVCIIFTCIQYTYLDILSSCYRSFYNISFWRKEVDSCIPINVWTSFLMKYITNPKYVHTHLANNSTFYFCYVGKWKASMSPRNVNN